MKYIIGLLLVTFLASCNSTNEETIVIEDDINMQIQEEMDALWLEEEQEESEESKVVVLDANYHNPAGSVDMTIEYSLDEENKIDFIEVKATTYDVSEFNTEVQKLVWKTIVEVWEVEISGWSLTTEAFKEALK